MRSVVSIVGLLKQLQKGAVSYAILFTLAAGFLLVPGQSFALAPDLAASFKSGEWLIKTWETTEGLPENSATAMVQTSDGYLWFGTFNGLVRFDGVRFTVFDRSNTPELPSAAIVNLHLDRQERLWVSTDKGIVFLKGGKWSAVFGPTQGWTGDYVRTFAEGAGKFFVTSFNGKVFQFDEQRFQELLEPPGAKGRGYFGHIDRQGRFWVAQHKFIGTWDGERWHEALPADQFLSEDGGAGPACDGGLWLFNRRQLSKLEAGKITKQIELESITPGGFWSLTEDSRGDVWIATYNSGVLRASPAGKLTQITTTNGLSYVSVRFVFEDREENYWIGTSGGGLMRFKRRAFFTFDRTQGLPERIIRSVAITRPNEVLVGVYGGGVVRFANNVMTRVELPPPLNMHSYVQCVLEDSRERIWVGTFQQGLAILDGQNTRPIPTEESAGSVIQALFEDSRQRVWIAGDEGVSVCEGGQFQIYRTGAGHPLDGVRTFAEGPGSGAIWLGDSYQRLHRFQNGSFQEVVPAGDPIEAPIQSLRVDADSTVWVGTGGAGFGRLRNGRFARIANAQGLPAKRIGSMFLDDSDHFWLGTEMGVIRVSHAELMAVADGARRQVVCQVFDQRDGGLLTTECATVSQPGSARDHEGRLWFATAKGLSVVDPLRFQTYSNPPPVRIERVLFTDKDGKAHTVEPSFGPPLPIPPGSRAVEVQFTALSFTAPSKVIFATQLTRNGLEITSSESDRRAAMFNWLPPGNYSFRVSAANHHGVWNRVGATLNFTMLPFFWQTGGFRLVVVVVFFLGSIGIVLRVLHNKHRHFEERLAERKRAQELLVIEHTHRLQAEREGRALGQRLLTAHEMERSRVARELHDDVTQRLARLAIDAAQAERGVLIAPDNGAPRSMHKELVRLSEDVHSIAYRLHPSILDELGLVEALRAECDRVSRRDSIRAELTSGDVPREIPREVALCLFRIGQESLCNVARHSHADTVEVSLIGADGGLQLVVRDDGIGFNPSRNRDGPSLGHASMRERINLVEGDLEIESAPNKGTTIVAWVPFNRTIKS